MNVAVVSIVAGILAAKDNFLVLTDEEARRYVNNANRLYSAAQRLRYTLSADLEIQETELCPKCGAPTRTECAATGCETTKSRGLRSV